MATSYDLVVRGGTVIAPELGLHGVADVAIADGRIAAVGRNLAADRIGRTIDASGLLVTAGWVDLHVHVYPGVSHYGVDADPHCLMRGVTTAVDTGSAGADTLLGFRRYVVERVRTRVFFYCNIATIGMVCPDVNELEDLRYANVERTVRTCMQHPERLAGIKVRLSRRIVGDNGLQPLYRAREAADRLGLPLMVHPSDPWGTLDEVLAAMRQGDIFTHCFHGRGENILDDGGEIRPCVWAARERGVLFDVGHGAGSFAWRVAERAIAQGFLPDTISSDLHAYNLAGPVYDQATTVSKFLALGMSLDAVIARTTTAAAAAIGQAETLGTLRVGAVGDLAIWQLETGRFPLTDTHRETRYGEQRLVRRWVILGGEIVAGE